MQVHRGRINNGQLPFHIKVSTEIGLPSLIKDECDAFLIGLQPNLNGQGAAESADLELGDAASMETANA